MKHVSVYDTIFKDLLMKLLFKKQRRGEFVFSLMHAQVNVSLGELESLCEPESEPLSLRT